MDHQQDLLTDLVTTSLVKRSKLLPWWIKVFMWIFMVFGLLVPVVLLLSVLGFNPQLAIYGLEANDAFTFTGLLLVLVFALKGVVSFGMIKEKDWAVRLGIIDAIVGISICVFTAYVYPFLVEGAPFSFFKFELIFLIPYFLKLNKIKDDWALAQPQ